MMREFIPKSISCLVTVGFFCFATPLFGCRFHFGAGGYSSWDASHMAVRDPRSGRVYSMDFTDSNAPDLTQPKPKRKPVPQEISDFGKHRYKRLPPQP